MRTAREGMILEDFIAEQKAFSETTFGPGLRTQGIMDHINREFLEILMGPTDVREWIDVILLALDGAWRSGATPEQICDALRAKLEINKARDWPDWRKADFNKAIEHRRG